MRLWRETPRGLLEGRYHREGRKKKARDPTGSRAFFFIQASLRVGVQIELVWMRSKIDGVALVD